MLTFISPKEDVLIFTSNLSTNEGRFFISINLTFLFSQYAFIGIIPPGASNKNSVIGSSIWIKFFSNKTVDTQIQFDPLIGGLSSGSSIIKPASASLFFGDTSKLKCLNTPPLGSLSKKFLKTWSSSKFLDCSNKVSPFKLKSPLITTSPISPSQLTLNNSREDDFIK